MFELQVLGPPVLQGGAAPWRWRRELRLRLLAHLALQGQPVDRDRLAFLFWPDTANEAARTHLRKTWFKLHVLPGVRAAAPLQADSASLAWLPATDLVRWKALLAGGQLRAAVALYRGPLLQGLDGGSAEFDRWLGFERERLQRLQRQAVLDLLPELQATEHAQALGWIDTLRAQDPLDEALAAAQVSLLAAAGQQASARRFHARWRRQMREELGVEGPEDELPRWLAQARAASSVAPAAPTSGTPVYLNTFIGRVAELQAIGDWLAAAMQGGPRLLTLIGPPGSGKSRLAAEACARASGVQRRVFVELDRLPPAMAPAPAGRERELLMLIAQALGLQLNEGGQPLERLAEALEQRPTLLVLDNAEHRSADRALLQRLLRLPTLRLLCTSRLRLNLDGERWLEVEGLQDAALPLFLARVGGPLPPAALADARGLCELLQGQPLAIELAARMCRGLTPAELHLRVAADLDTLQDTNPETPPRQRSLRAAFDVSWRLMPETLQRALAQLAVLRADFSREAARAVAGVADATLSALIDHSLLRLDAATARLRWHPFVRDHALARLAADSALHAQSRQAHAAWFAHRLRTLDLREEHPEPSALREAALEAENIVDAWRHAIELGRHDDWETLAEALALHHEIKARYREGAALLALCELSAALPEQRRAAARVAVLRARLLHWVSNEEADALAGEAEVLLQALGDDAGLIAAWRVRAVVAWRRGDSVRAIERFQCALALGERSGQTGKQAILLDGLGLARLHQGDTQGSRAAFEQALALNERSGNGLQRVHNLINLSLDARARTPDEAMALARRALGLAREIGFEHYVPHGLVTQAMAHAAAGDTAQARSVAGEAVAITRRSGDSYVESWALTVLARAAWQDGDLPATAQALIRGLELSWQDQDLGLLSHHLVLAAEWMARAGRRAMAADLTATLMAQGALPAWQRRLLLALQQGLPPTPSPQAAAGLAAQVHRTLGALTEFGTP